MSSRTIDYKAILSPKPIASKPGLFHVYVRATKDRKKSEFGTGIYIKPEQWDEQNQQKPITSHRDKDTLNRSFDGFLKRLKDIESTGREKNPGYSAANLKADYQQDDKKAFTHFCAFALDRIAQLKKQKPDTIARYKNSVSTFQQFARGRDQFGKITHALADEFFQHYLPGKEKSATANTQVIYLKHLRHFEREAEEFGLIKAEQKVFAGYNRSGKHIKTTKPERDWLEERELARLEAYSIPAENDYWQRLRDFYLFMCYTGLRFKDAASLTKNNFQETPDGLELTVRSAKTGKKITFPLYLLFPAQDDQPGTRPERLVRRYWKTSAKPFFATTKTGGGKPNGSKANAGIQAIVAEAGITGKHITQHTARHTFASFLITRVPITVVRELLQHSKIETTMIYAHQSRETINQHLRKAVWHD